MKFGDKLGDEFSEEFGDEFGDEFVINCWGKYSNSPNSVTPVHVPVLTSYFCQMQLRVFFICGTVIPLSGIPEKVQTIDNNRRERIRQFYNVWC